MYYYQIPIILKGSNKRNQIMVLDRKVTFAFAWESFALHRRLCSSFILHHKFGFIALRTFLWLENFALNWKFCFKLENFALNWKLLLWTGKFCFKLETFALNWKLLLEILPCTRNFCFALESLDFIGNFCFAPGN